jgi:hypothetical protein
MLKILCSKLAILTERINPQLGTFRARLNFGVLVVGLACVLAVGPFLQLYSFALITSDEASIYSTAYSSQVVRQPPFGEWVITLVWPQFFAMALFIVLSLRAESFRSAFIRMSGVVFLVVTVFDFVMLLMNWNLLSVEAIQCLVANLIGAPIVAAIILGMIALAEWFAVVLKEHSLIRSVLTSAAPMLCGLASLFLAHYLITLFYKPTESRVLLRGGTEVYAYYGTSPPKVDASTSNAELPSHIKAASKAENLQIFGEQVRVPRQLYWDGLAKEFEANWRNESGSKYDLEIRVLDGCSGAPSIGDLEKAKPLRFQEVDQVAIGGDDGLVTMYVGRGEDPGYFKATQDDVGMFWLTESNGEDAKSYGIQRFVGENTQVTYWNPTGNIDLGISRLLISHDENGRGHPAKQKISLFVDGERLDITFIPEESARWDDKVSCKAATIPEGASEVVIRSALYASVFLSLVPRDKTIRTALSRREGDQFKVKGINGWLVADGVTEGEVGNFITSGKVSMIGLSAGVKELELNDEEVEIEKGDRVHAMGELSMSVEGGELLARGKVEAISKNESRINRTRWERMEWPARTVLFGGVPALLLSLLSLFSLALRANKMVGAKFGLRRDRSECSS